MESDQHLSCINRVSPAISTAVSSRILYTAQYYTKREQPVAEYIQVHFAKRSLFQNVNNHSVNPVYLKKGEIPAGSVRE